MGNLLNKIFGAPSKEDQKIGSDLIEIITGDLFKEVKTSRKDFVVFSKTRFNLYFEKSKISDLKHQKVIINKTLENLSLKGISFLITSANIILAEKEGVSQ